MDRHDHRRHSFRPAAPAAAIAATALFLAPALSGCATIQDAVSSLPFVSSGKGSQAKATDGRSTWATSFSPHVRFSGFGVHIEKTRLSEVLEHAGGWDVSESAGGAASSASDVASRQMSPGECATAYLSGGDHGGLEVAVTYTNLDGRDVPAGDALVTGFEVRATGGLDGSADGSTSPDVSVCGVSPSMTARAAAAALGQSTVKDAYQHYRYSSDGSGNSRKTDSLLLSTEMAAGAGSHGGKGAANMVRGVGIYSACSSEDAAENLRVHESTVSPFTDASPSVVGVDVSISESDVEGDSSSGAKKASGTSNTSNTSNASGTSAGASGASNQSGQASIALLDGRHYSSGSGYGFEYDFDQVWTLSAQGSPAVTRLEARNMIGQVFVLEDRMFDDVVDAGRLAQMHVDGIVGAGGSARRVRVDFAGHAGAEGVEYVLDGRHGVSVFLPNANSDRAYMFVDASDSASGTFDFGYLAMMGARAA